MFFSGNWYRRNRLPHASGIAKLSTLRGHSGPLGDWLDGYLTYVAEYSRTITGFFMLETSSQMKMAFVLPQYRRSGLADALHFRLLADARSMGLSRLTVLASHVVTTFCEAWLAARTRTGRRAWGNCAKHADEVKVVVP